MARQISDGISRLEYDLGFRGVKRFFTTNRGVRKDCTNNFRQEKDVEKEIRNGTILKSLNPGPS